MKKLNRIYFISSLTLTALAGCAGEATIDGLTVATTASGVLPTSCSIREVDRGIKGAAAGTARGQSSDVKTIPGTLSPAVAYVDGVYSNTPTGSQVVKFSYWNGSDFIQEVVAPQAAGKAIRMHFLSDGTPIIVWSETPAATATFPAFLRMAVRAAPLSATTLTTSTWTVSTIDNGSSATSAPDYVGIGLAVSPLDQVAISYMYVVGASTNRAPRLAVCASNCKSATNYQVMSGTNIANETAGAGFQPLSTPVSWCRAGATTYYPVVAYANTANTVKHAVCAQSNPIACLTSTSTTWRSQTFTAAAAVQALDLYTDPTVFGTNGDTPKMVVATATNFRAVQFSLGCDLDPTAGNWATTNTPVVVSATSQGVSGFAKIAKDAAGKFHTVVNTGTTNMLYFNSATTNFVGTWNAAGTIETATLATGVFNGGIAHATTAGGQILYTTYPTGAATTASAHDLRLGVVGAPDLSSVNASQVYYQTAVDRSGGILPPARPTYAAANAQMRAVSSAYSAGGKPAVAYVDYSATLTAAAGTVLKFASRDGTDVDDAWFVRTIPGTTLPRSPHLYYHPTRGTLFVSYYDETSRKYRIASNSQVDGSGSWNEYDFPMALNTAVLPTMPANNESCLTRYSAGGIDYLVMVILNSNATAPTTYQQRIFSSRLNLSTGVWSAITPTPIALSATGGAHLTCATDANNHLAIAYENLDALNLRAYYSSSTDGGTTWATPLSISASGAGVGARLTLVPTTGTPSVAFYDLGNNKVQLAECSGTVASCATGGWTTSDAATGIGVSSLAAAPASVYNHWFNAPLFYSTTGKPSVFYTNGPASSGVLASSARATTTFATTSHGGGTAADLSGLSAYPLYSFPIMTAGAQSADDYLMVSYVGPGNRLYALTCGD